MSKNRIIVFFSSIALLVAITFIHFGCKHDPPLFSNICFESEVLPIFQNNCTNSSCHNQQDRIADIVLTTFDNIMAAGIKPHDAKGSKVYKAITGGGESAMPPKGKLTGTQIALIYSWIQNGAENTTGCSIVDSIPTVECDTTNVKYSTVISPLFTSVCLSCHGSGSDADFSSYSALSDYLSGDSQTLLNDINYVSGSTHMPPSGKLDSCSIKKITIWIHAGYPGN